MKEYNKGTIRGSAFEFGSGIGFLYIEDEQGALLSVPCEKGPTIRALKQVFEDKGGCNGHEIYWSYDESGSLLDGFTPVPEASLDLIEAYNDQHPTFN